MTRKNITEKHDAKTIVISILITSKMGFHLLVIATVIRRVFNISSIKAHLEDKPELVPEPLLLDPGREEELPLQYPVNNLKKFLLIQSCLPLLTFLANCLYWYMGNKGKL